MSYPGGQDDRGPARLPEDLAGAPPRRRPTVPRSGDILPGRHSPTGPQTVPGRDPLAARATPPGRGTLPGRAAASPDGIRPPGVTPATQVTPAGASHRPVNPPSAARGRAGQARGDAGRRSPIRGYPPMPGQPDPVYPPGQFSGWNRPSVRAAWLGLAGGGHPSGENDAEPGYSLLAVSDPSADATSTQTWAAIDDSGDWAVPASPRGRLVRDDGHPVQAAAGPGSAPSDVTDAQRAAAGAGSGQGSRTGAARAGHGSTGRRGSRAGASSRQPAPPRRRTGLAGRSNRVLASLLVAPVVIVMCVAAVYVAISRTTPKTPVVGPTRLPVTPGDPGASLGTWKYITARSDDPVALTLQELFPSTFSADGSAGTRTVESAGTHCASSVIGSALASAIRKAGCTQVMRASYLSTNSKLMATIGVLNLATVTDAQHVGSASGASEFIEQLPGPHGPTSNLASGTGIEEAIVKGHYLILIVAEFANLSSPSSASSRTQLEQFESGLFAGTVNVSLTSRMVTGKPHIP